MIFIRKQISIIIFIAVILTAGYFIKNQFDKYKISLYGVSLNTYEMQADSDDWKINGGLYINSYHFKSISFKDITYGGDLPLDYNVRVAFYEMSSPEKILYTIYYDDYEDGNRTGGISQFFTKDSVRYSITPSYAGSEHLAMKVTMIHNNEEESSQIIPIMLTKIGMLKSE